MLTSTEQLDQEEVVLDREQLIQDRIIWTRSADQKKKQAGPDREQLIQERISWTRQRTVEPGVEQLETARKKGK